MSSHDRIRLIGSLSFGAMRRRIWTALLILYAGGIFALSQLPLGAGEPLFPHIDKCFHAAEFAVFFALAWVATGRRTVAAFLLTFFYAGTDELHQLFVATRTASALDLGADMLGAAFAALLLPPLARLWALLRRRILRPQHSKVES